MANLFYDRSAARLIDMPGLNDTLLPVFGNFLFVNELGILFGDSNTGKSILGVDIGISYVYGHNFGWGDDMSLFLKKTRLYISTLNFPTDSSPVGSLGLQSMMTVSSAHRIPTFFMARLIPAILLSMSSQK